MDILVDKALELFVKPAGQTLGRQLGYLYYYGDNIKELKDLAGKIEEQRKIITLRVDAGDPIINWLDDAQSNIDKVDQFLIKDQLHRMTGCSRRFPNLKLRYQHGKKANKMSSECKALLDQKPNFNEIDYLPPSGAADIAIYGIGYVSFNSRKDIMEKVMNELGNPETKMIGIYGQGGVGKTAFVKEVAKKAKEEQLFSVVIANITGTPDVRKIQGEMADQLGLSLREESTIGRAARLRRRLKGEKNVLIILDDLWAGFDLNKLGILYRDDDISPMTVKGTVDSKGCKILVTSRSKEVLSSEMGIKEPLPLDVLKKEEAVGLFKWVAKVTEEDSQLNSLLDKIASRCAELPIAIVPVANALRNTKSILDLKTALEQMEMQEAVKPVEFSTKLSYDHMQSGELKSFFLLCARISKNLSITDLVKYCIGLGIFKGVYTVKEARDRTDIMVKKLKASNLLLNAHSSGQVTMHDLVRDAALSIAFKEQDIFTMRYSKLDEWPDKENFERYTAISLHHCDINDEIPQSLNCPRVKVFHVESNNPSLIIPDTLFEGMEELRVLVLIGIDLSSLPSSIKSLKKLRMLCLEQCVLGGNISIIGELKKLRVLSLSGSKFADLPSELGQLAKLQLFDISNCTKLRVIPPNVISNLISLEEFYMENDVIQWSVEGQTNRKEIACLYELWNLDKLKRLNICVQDISALPRSLPYDKLDGYTIVIGLFERVLFEDFKMRCMFEASKALALQLKKGNGIYFHMGLIKMLLKSVDHLFLGELDGVPNVIDELNLEGFPYLKHLTITNNTDIQYIINSMELGKRVVAFPNLESMYLYKLPIMEKISNCLITNESFGNLRTIKINICSRLKNLFPYYMVEFLANLEIIEVSACEALQEIVFDERQDICNDVKFPQLHTLTLQSLPILTSFYSNKSMLPRSRKDEISVADEQISTWVPMLFNINVSVQNLTQLNVKDCGNLEYLFSLSMARSLDNLQSLSVETCAMMKHIFQPEDDQTNKVKEGIKVFPQLKQMEITCMEELKAVWLEQASLQSFCSLDYVIVKDCNKLVTIFPNYMAGRFGSLGKLEVINCKGVEKIFDDVEDSNDIDGRNGTNLWNLHIELLPKLKYIWSTDPERILDFKNLQNVQVIACSDLENVFPISVARDLSKLEYIQVSTCPKMKDIVSNEGASEKNIKFDLGQLTTVAFQQLPQLTSFYREGHSIEFSTMKQLYLTRCDRLKAPESFLSHQVISKLEALAIGPKEMEWLQGDIGNDLHRLHNIKILYLDGLRSMETPFWFLNRTPNLENLFLVRCFIKEMLSSGSLDAHEKIWTFVHLKSLRLWYLHGVQHIGFLNHPIIQRVEQLYLVDCSSLNTLFPSFISLTHLTCLEVSRCPRLENLMTSSTAKSLVQLIEMKISQCEIMREIVIKDEKEKLDEIVFSKLKSLELVELRDLKCFCSCKEGLAFKFPSLEKLILRDCFQMEYFCKNITCIPKLKEVNVAESKEGYWKGDLNKTIKKLFKDLVFFQYTEDLRLFQHPVLEKVCQGKVPMPQHHCFRNIKSLVVVNCFFISSAFLAKLLSYLKNLEKLKVGSTPTEVIFDIDKLAKVNKGSYPVKTLTLDGLPFLKCVCSKDPHGFVSFPNLQEVVVSRCEKLETLLPLSIAKNLVKLEVSECYTLVEIVGKAEAVAFKQSTFQLPSLNSLLLYDLPELQCFYPGVSIPECPKLDGLRVIKCTRLDIFTSEVPRHQGAHGHQDEVATSTHKQPHFLIEKVITNLETLWLNKKMTSMLCLRQQLHKLKDLRLFFGDEDDDSATIFPFEFLQKLPHLSSLFIGHFNSLEENLPSIASFCNLKQLIITECLGLVFLLSSSAAQSLVQLEKMIIRKCKSLKQIVSSEIGELTSDKVIFEKLTDIKLISLSSLVTFYSGNAAVHFPILEVASIFDCPMMKIFSRGDISAPNFLAIQTSQDPCDLHYSGSLNSTLEKLFWDRVRGVQDLKLGGHPELEDIWRGDLQIQEMTFSKLKSLVVEGCEICSILPFHLLSHLSNLEALEVRKCVSVKTIFDVSNIKALDSGPAPSFSLRLKKLILEELPNLKHIWNEHPQGILSLQCLQQVCVDGCKAIKSLLPTSMYIDRLENLEVKCCEGLEEIIAKDEASSNNVFIFKNLSSLTLWELPELKYFYRGLHHLEWPRLNLLNVYHCCKLRTFTTEFPSHLHEAQSEDEQAIVLVEKIQLLTLAKWHLDLVVPKLEELLLSKNDIMIFSHERFAGWLFKSIRYLKLIGFHGDETTFPCSFLLKVRNIEKLLVRCSSFREIFPSTPQLEGSEAVIFQALGFLSRLKELELNDLRELVSIGLEYSWHTIPSGLQSLRVVGCSSLTHLVSYTVSFSSLVDLTVTECHKLEYVFTSSTAKTLALLKNMSISRCNSMKEIVAELVEVVDDDSVMYDIVMPQLETLSLYSLPELECFYSGSSTVNLECLREVSINECVTMEIFCQRGLKTPLLPQDLDAGIQEAHDTKTPFSVCVQTPWAHRSNVDEDSIERDTGPYFQQGALFRKLDAIVYDVTKYLSNLLDQIPFWPASSSCKEDGKEDGEYNAIVPCKEDGEEEDSEEEESEEEDSEEESEEDSEDSEEVTEGQRRLEHEESIERDRWPNVHLGADSTEVDPIVPSYTWAQLTEVDPIVRDPQLYAQVRSCFGPRS